MASRHATDASSTEASVPLSVHLISQYGSVEVTPVEVTTDQATVYPAVLEELLPAAWHRIDQYANNRIEADHGRLKARLRPMRLRAAGRTQTVPGRPHRRGVRWICNAAPAGAVPACLVGWSEPGNQAKGGDTW